MKKKQTKNTYTKKKKQKNKNNINLSKYLVGKKVDFIIGQAYILIEKNDTSFSFGSTATITILKYNITD